MLETLAPLSSAATAGWHLADVVTCPLPPQVVQAVVSTTVWVGFARRLQVTQRVQAREGSSQRQTAGSAYDSFDVLGHFRDE